MIEKAFTPLFLSFSASAEVASRILMAGNFRLRKMMTSSTLTSFLREISSLIACGVNERTLGPTRNAIMVRAAREAMDSTRLNPLFLSFCVMSLAVYWVR